MNPNYNSNQVFSNSHLLKKFLARTSVLTVTIASAILSVFIMVQTIISGYSGKKINMLSALYYLFGNNSISVVNIVFGSIVSLISILLFVSFLSIYLKAKSNDDDSPSTGLSLLLFSSVAYIVVAVITIVLSFASISVLRYENQSNIHIHDYREFTSSDYNTYSSFDGSMDLFKYVFFGASAIMLSIGAIRLVLSMIKSCKGEPLANRGNALLLTGTLSMAALTCIAFFTTLGNLVMPAVSENSELDPIALVFTIVNVLIFGAATTVLIGLSFLSSHYSAIVNKTRSVLPQATSYYASYATNVYPSNAVRPVNPNMSRPQAPVQNSQYPPYQGVPAYQQPIQQNQSSQPSQYQSVVNDNAQQTGNTQTTSSDNNIKEPEFKSVDNNISYEETVNDNRPV